MKRQITREHPPKEGEILEREGERCQAIHDYSEEYGFVLVLTSGGETRIGGNYLFGGYIGDTYIFPFYAELQHAFTIQN